MVYEKLEGRSQSFTVGNFFVVSTDAESEGREGCQLWTNLDACLSEAAGQATFYEAFGLSVCFDCQRVQRAKFGVISKSKAKDEYLLTDRQIGELGCRVTPNPHDARYGDMKLYLRSQVGQLALRVWESDEALFEERERRSAERLQKAAAKKRKVAAGADERPGFQQRAPPAAKSKAGRGKAVPAAPWAATARHEHEFGPGEPVGDDGVEFRRSCACGFEEVYEEF